MIIRRFCILVIATALIQVHGTNAFTNLMGNWLKIPEFAKYNRIKEIGNYSTKFSSSEKMESGEDPKNKRFPLFNFQPEHVFGPLFMCLCLLVSCFAKIGFEALPVLHKLLPESCMLVIVGIFIGLLPMEIELELAILNANTFFLFLLPPIVLDASSYMPYGLFFSNLGPILWLAGLGTLFNAVAVAISLWGVGVYGYFETEAPILDMLLFGSIIAAVDPVAVLAVFQEVNVDEVLYIIVFGESLLNDAITVVLYHMFVTYVEIIAGGGSILVVDILAGIGSLFIVVIGGLLVGAIFGLLTSFLSRFTHTIHVIEPLFVMVMAYMSYIVAEMCEVSAILSLATCGILMKSYVAMNITKRSSTALRYFFKVLASASETIIFILLGLYTVQMEYHFWDTTFILCTILFCTIYRAVGVFSLAAWCNRSRTIPLTFLDKFIMTYGGLRGAIAFALILIVPSEIVANKKLMFTAVLSMIYFTMFIQGSTIGPLVKFLKMTKGPESKKTMNESLHTSAIENMMVGIGFICGHDMGAYRMKEKFEKFNNEYLLPVLANKKLVKASDIFETFSKIASAEAKQSQYHPYGYSEQSDSSMGDLYIPVDIIQPTSKRASILGPPRGLIAQPPTRRGTIMLPPTRRGTIMLPPTVRRGTIVQPTRRATIAPLPLGRRGTVIQSNNLTTNRTLTLLALTIYFSATMLKY